MAKDLRYSVESVAFDEVGENAQGTHDVYTANHLFPRDRTAGQKAGVCDICGEELRERQIRMFRGVAYGIPCGCSADIGSILRQEDAEKAPAVRFEERESKILTE